MVAMKKSLLLSFATLFVVSFALSSCANAEIEDRMSKEFLVGEEVFDLNEMPSETESYATERSSLASNQFENNPMETDYQSFPRRELETAMLVDFYKTHDPIEVAKNDVFMGMEISEIKHIQHEIDKEWVTTHLSVQFEGDLVLSGEIIYGEPTFFLPDEKSMEKLPRLYNDGLEHMGIQFLDYKAINEYLEENYGDRYNKESIYSSKVVFQNYNFVVMKKTGNAEYAHLVSIDNVLI